MQTDPLSSVRLLCTGKLPVNHITVQLTATLKTRIWLPKAFKKNSRYTHQGTLKPCPVSERSTYYLQN